MIGTANYQMTAEAWPVVNRMSALDKTEVTALKRYVKVEVRDANWASFDEIMCQVLGSTDGLKGFFTKTATNFGSVSFGAQGASFSGSNYLKTTFDPSSDHTRSSWTSTDAAYSVYIFNPSVGSAIHQRPFAVRSGSYFIQPASQISSDPNIYSTINATNSLGPNSDGHDNAEYFTAYRTSSTIYLWKNGSQLTSASQTGSTVPAYDMWVGTMNNANVSTTPYFGDVGFVAMGSKTDLDVAKHYTNVLDFLTDLSAI